MAKRRAKAFDLRAGCTYIGATLANTSRYSKAKRQKVFRGYVSRFDRMDSRIFISYGVVGKCVW